MEQSFSDNLIKCYTEENAYDGQKKNFSTKLIQLPLYRAIYNLLLHVEMFVVFSFSVKYEINGGIVSSLFGTSALFAILVNICRASCDKDKESKKLTKFDYGGLVLFVVAIAIFIVDSVLDS